MFCYDGLPISLRLVLCIVATVIAIRLVSPKQQIVKAIRQKVRALSCRPILSLLVVFAVSFFTNAILGTIQSPSPKIHDEWAYLLAADTYASGRLANPTHTHWEHFETFHVLSKPSYIAKYPPGNGMALALGQILTGDPIVGNWIVLALALAATCWMLRAWVGNYWAFVGSLLLAINVSMLMAWGQTYWGGGVALLGGALLFGSMRKMASDHYSPSRPWVFGLLFGVGAVLLAVSRPFEGVIVCLIAATVLLVWLCKSPKHNWQPAIKFSIPMIFVGALGIALLLANNREVTGDAFKLPYSVHSSQYSATSTWLWGTMPTIPEYNLPRMESLYVNWSRARQIEAKTVSGYLALVCKKLNLLWGFFPLLGGVCLVPLLIFYKTSNRWLFLALGVFCGLLLIELQMVHNYTYPHYLAPVVPLFYVAIFTGLRLWRVISRKNQLARFVLPTAVTYSVLCLCAYVFWLAATTNPLERTQVEQKLFDHGVNHLVFVSYQDDHYYHKEWVYNKADIDRSEIVWANDLSPEKNAKLIEYYGNSRQVWLLTVGSQARLQRLDSPLVPVSNDGDQSHRTEQVISCFKTG